MIDCKNSEMQEILESQPPVVLIKGVNLWEVTVSCKLSVKTNEICDKFEFIIHAKI